MKETYKIQTSALQFSETCGMMSPKSPDSKQARDDTTAIVVFF